MYYTKFNLYAEIDPNHKGEYDLQRYDADTGFKLECTVGVTFSVWVKTEHKLDEIKDLHEVENKLAGIIRNKHQVYMTPIKYTREPQSAIDVQNLELISDNERLAYLYYVKVFDYFSNLYKEKYLTVPDAYNDASVTEKPEGVKIIELVL